MKLLWFFILVVLFTATTHAQVSATFTGDSVKIWDSGFDWSCSGRFFAVTTTVQDTIYITERDTNKLVTCTCYFTVSTSFSGLAPGTYTAKVTRQHIQHIMFPTDTVYVRNEFAGTVTFTIVQAPSASPKISFYQSGCNSGPGHVPEDNSVPGTFAMLTNHPNPFNPTTTIRYTIPYSAHVSLAVYSVTGQIIEKLVDEDQHYGSYEMEFNGRNVPSGIYLCRLTYGERSLSNTMVLIK